MQKYVLVEGLAKLVGPNMDIVDVLFFLLVHRPDLQVCSDSHLDILVLMNSALWVTLLHG